MEELVELFFYAGYMGLALLVPFSNYVLQVCYPAF